MANEKNFEGKRVLFSSTNQPKNRGRKPKLYTIAHKGYSLSLDDYKGVVRYLMQCSKKEIERIQADEQTPMWIVTICRALHMDASRGSARTLNELVERLFGKAQQSVDIDAKVSGSVEVIKGLSPDKAKEYLDKINDIE